MAAGGLSYRKAYLDHKNMNKNSRKAAKLAQKVVILHTVGVPVERRRQGSQRPGACNIRKSSICLSLSLSVSLSLSLSINLSLLIHTHVQYVCIYLCVYV